MRFLTANLVFIFFTLAIISCGTANIISTANTNVKPDIEVSQNTKAVFFIENPKIKDNSSLKVKQKDIAERVYKSFGGASTDMIVGNTNAKTFLFNNNNEKWFVDVAKVKKRYAMLIYDGDNKPVIEDNPDLYDYTIKKYLGLDLTKAYNRNKDKFKSNAAALRLMRGFISSTYKPNLDYATALIKHANTSIYTLPPLPDDEIKSGIYETIAYADSTKSSKTYVTYYTYLNDGTNHIKEIVMQYTGSPETKMRYYYNNLGLIDSIISWHGDKKEFSTYFKYLYDRYITYTSMDGAREEFIFNNDKQVIKRRGYRNDNSLYFNIDYEYDKQGRIVRQWSYAEGANLENMMLFTFDNPRSGIYSKLIMYGKDKQIISQTTIAKIKDKYTYNFGNGTTTVYQREQDGNSFSATYTNGKMISFTTTKKVK